MADDEGGSGINCASINPCQANYNTKFDDQFVAIACCERYSYGTTGYYH